MADLSAPKNKNVLRVSSVACHLHNTRQTTRKENLCNTGKPISVFLDVVVNKARLPFSRFSCYFSCCSHSCDTQYVVEQLEDLRVRYTGSPKTTTRKHCFCPQESKNKPRCSHLCLEVKSAKQSLIKKGQLIGCLLFCRLYFFQ